MTKRLVLDAGHGAHDAGAVANGLKEKDLTLDIAKRIKNKLKNYDIDVIMTRTTDKYLTLSERANIANRNNADAFVSIHINAGGGTGFESFIFNGTVSNDTKFLQNKMHDAIVNKTSMTNRGKKKANFAVVRQTRMPSVLTENLFIDRKEDAAKLKDSKFIDKIAQGHVDGIVSYFNLSNKGGTSKPIQKPSTSSKQPKTSGKSITQMAKEVIDGKHGNGHDTRRKSLGVSKSEYEKVRKEVNAIASGKKKKPTTTKTIQQMAYEVKKGLHGNGHETRRKSLGISKSEYEKVRDLVNTGIHPSSNKSISKMAQEVIDGKHGQGHANRRKSLGISQKQYNKVRAEVNKRLQ